MSVNFTFTQSGDGVITFINPSNFNYTRRYTYIIEDNLGNFLFPTNYTLNTDFFTNIGLTVNYNPTYAQLTFGGSQTANTSGPLILTIDNSFFTPNRTYYITITTAVFNYAYAVDSFSLINLNVSNDLKQNYTVGSDSEFYCLFEDTDVLTPSGYVSVKTLQEGNLVITSDGRTSHIKRIWSSNMPLQEQFYPIVIKANSITENYPPKDCRLSKYHLINFNGKWITPYKNEHVFKYDRDVKTIKYYHLELENYFTDHLVINGGLVVESLTNGKEDTGIEWDTGVKNSIIL